MMHHLNAKPRARSAVLPAVLSALLAVLLAGCTTFQPGGIGTGGAAGAAFRSERLVDEARRVGLPQSEVEKLAAWWPAGSVSRKREDAEEAIGLRGQLAVVRSEIKALLQILQG